MKSRRTPQSWVSTQRKAASKTPRDDLEQGQGGKSEMLSTRRPQGTALAASKRTTLVRGTKKLPPPPDASDDVFEEYMSSIQKKTTSIAHRETPSDERLQKNCISRTSEVEGTVLGSPNGNVPLATLGAELPLRRNSEQFNSPTAVSRDHSSGNRRQSNTNGPNYCAISSDDERTANKRKSSNRTSRHRSRSLSPYSSEKEEERMHHNIRHAHSIFRSSSSPDWKSRSHHHRERQRTSSPRIRSKSRHHRQDSYRRHEGDGGLDSYDRVWEHYYGGRRSREWSARYPSRKTLSPLPRTSSPAPQPLGAGGLQEDIGGSRVRGVNDVARNSSGTRTARLLTGLPLSLESTHRQERRSRESQREDDLADRTRNGKKPYHVNVNWEGKPYGLGISVWNDALAKVVRGLDPSYVDIRQQPFCNMEILMRRLDDDFEYSAPINPSWLRTRIGNALSSYRHEIIRMIQREQDRPPWVSEAVWQKLVRLEGSDKFRTKSLQMKYANACRKNKGRTGPLGEAGITERLRQQLQRSPTADEIFEEMSRDKGYSGRSRKSTPRQPSKSNSVQEDESLCGVPEDTYGDILAQSSPPADGMGNNTSHPLLLSALPSFADPMMSPSTAATSTNSDSVSNLLLAIIERQIQELQSCPVGETADGVALILTLQCRLDAMKQRTLIPTSSEDPPVQYDTTSRVPDSGQNLPRSSSPLPEEFPNDTAERDLTSRKEKATTQVRKSSRPSKKKVRTY